MQMGCTASKTAAVEPERRPHVKKRKKPIPAALRRAVWNTWIGEQRGVAKCMCCNMHTISQMNFHCGHVKAEAMGGMTCAQNLRPICSLCNSSMGIRNMKEFQATHFPDAPSI
jgi:hypothetical protein